MPTQALDPHKYLRTCHQNILQRTENSKDPSFKYYGARGIRIWEGWRNADDFIAGILSDIGERPPGVNPRTGLSLYQLDRKDSGLGYQPGNLRWVTVLENERNKKRWVSAMERKPRARSDKQKYPGYSIHFTNSTSGSLEFTRY
jgi:hypothetical protein